MGHKPDPNFVGMYSKEELEYVEEHTKEMNRKRKIEGIKTLALYFFGLMCLVSLGLSIFSIVK